MAEKAKRRRFTRAEQEHWVFMLWDAERICWKLQGEEPLDAEDARCLAAMPPAVRAKVLEVGARREPPTYN